LSILILILFVLVPTAQAGLVQCGTSETDPCQPGDLIDNVFYVVNFLVGVATLVTISYIVYGGVRMILAAGDPGQIKSAKDTMTNAITGLIIILLSYIIISSVVGYLTGYSLENLRLFIRV
jgi:hypothetical protein